MTKQELIETCSAEQLAEMLVELNEKDEQSQKIYEALQKDYEKIYKNYKEKNENSKEKELQSEVDKYRKAFEDAKNERDCQIAELKEYTDSLKCSVDRKQDAINQIDSIICELFGVAHYGDIYSEDFKELLKEKSAVGKTVCDFLPTEPIKVADMLINASKKRTNCMNGKEYDKYIFEKWQLRQIAEHLLVYCNNQKENVDE